MNALPRFAVGVALAFWGWRSGHYAAAAALALVLEAPQLMRLRFELDHADFARVSDLCTVLLVAVLAWLFVSLEAPRTARAVLTTMLWLPALLAPLLLVQRISARARLPLSALFLYLRRLRARDPAYRDVDIDLGPAYFAICMLAAGIPNARDPWFYGVLALVVAWALSAARPAHAHLATRVPALVVAVVLGYGVHSALRWSQAAFEDWLSDWFLGGIAADPYRSTTDLGAVGRLKMIDTILLRVYGRPDAPPPRLLHRVSFTTLEGSTWIARRAPMSPLEPQADGTSWPIAKGAPLHSTRMFIRLESGKAVLALPPGTVRILGMAAASVRRNALGATQAELGSGDWAPYVAEAGGAIDDYAGPQADDLVVPERERAAVQRVAAELGLAGLAPEQAIERVRSHLAAFRYSAYRENPLEGGRTPLADFLLASKSGHCEYFGAAATLLLRAANVPARYATGFAVYEYSALEDAYLVRARHAHAWTRAYAGGRWIDVDTTPASWTEEEDRARAPWEAFADLARWAQFRWAQRGPLEAGAGWALVLAFLIALFVWRLVRGKRAAPASLSLPKNRVMGADSEFYVLEAKLAARTGRREPHESLAAWIGRIAPALERSALEPLERTMALHYRYRFDPQGLDAAERRALREHCLALSARLESPHG